MTPEQLAAIKRAEQRAAIQRAEAAMAGGVSTNSEAVEQHPSAPKSWQTALWENVMGDNDPTTQNTGEKIGSLLNKAGESMTFGLIGDEASAAVESLVPGVDYGDRRDHYRQQERLIEETNPGLSIAADVGGALAAPLGALGTLGKGASMAKRMAASAGVTGAMGGVYGAMEGETPQERIDDGLSGAGWGAGIGAAIPLVGGAVQKAANARATRKAVKNAAKGAPTTEALRAQGNAAYQAIDDMGVQIKPEAFKNATDDITSTLKQNGLDVLPGGNSLTPKSNRVVDIMDDMNAQMAAEPTAALPFSSVDQLRRKAGVAASDVGNKLESSLGSQTIGKLDDFINTLPEDAVTQGDAKALGPAINKARDIWQRMSKSQLIDDAIEAGEGNYLSGGSSGIRNQFKRILRSPKLSRGFSDAEKAAMRKVINGTMPEQLLNLLGGGLGQLTTIGAGGALGSAGGPLGSAVGAAVGAGLGSVARKASEAVSSRNAETVRAMIANGGLQQTPQASALGRLLTERLMQRGTAVAQQ